MFKPSSGGTNSCRTYHIRTNRLWELIPILPGQLFKFCQRHSTQNKEVHLGSFYDQVQRKFQISLRHWPEVQMHSINQSIYRRLHRGRYGKFHSFFAESGIPTFNVTIFSNHSERWCSWKNRFYLFVFLCVLPLHPLLGTFWTDTEWFPSRHLNLSTRVSFLFMDHLAPNSTNGLTSIKPWGLRKRFRNSMTEWSVLGGWVSRPLDGQLQGWTVIFSPTHWNLWNRKKSWSLGSILHHLLAKSGKKRKSASKNRVLKGNCISGIFIYPLERKKYYWMKILKTGKGWNWYVIDTV